MGVEINDIPIELLCSVFKFVYQTSVTSDIITATKPGLYLSPPLRQLSVVCKRWCRAINHDQSQWSILIWLAYTHVPFGIGSRYLEWIVQYPACNIEICIDHYANEKNPEENGSARHTNHEHLEEYLKSLMLYSSRISVLYVDTDDIDMLATIYGSFIGPMDKTNLQVLHIGQHDGFAEDDEVLTLPLRIDFPLRLTLNDSKLDWIASTFPRNLRALNLLGQYDELGWDEMTSCLRYSPGLEELTFGDLLLTEESYSSRLCPNSGMSLTHLKRLTFQHFPLSQCLLFLRTFSLPRLTHLTILPRMSQQLTLPFHKKREFPSLTHLHVQEEHVLKLINQEFYFPCLTSITYEHMYDEEPMFRRTDNLFPLKGLWSAKEYTTDHQLQSGVADHHSQYKPRLTQLSLSRRVAWNQVFDSSFDTRYLRHLCFYGQNGSSFYRIGITSIPKSILSTLTHLAFHNIGSVTEWMFEQCFHVTHLSLTWHSRRDKESLDVLMANLSLLPDLQELEIVCFISKPKAISAPKVLKRLIIGLKLSENLVRFLLARNRHGNPLQKLAIRGLTQGMDLEEFSRCVPLVVYR